MSGVILCVICLLATAAEDGLSAQVDRLFALVETPPGKNRTELQKQLQSLAPKPTDDVRLRYAYIVALLHENKHKDALREVNLLVRSHPKHIQGQRLRAWLLLTQKKYTEALPVLDTISRLIPSQEGQGAVEEADLEMAQFLGTAMGFFEGPAEDLVKESVRKQYRTRIEARLTDKRREVFDEQIKAVAATFADFRDDGAAQFASAEENHAQKLRAIQDKGEQLKNARDKTEADAEKTADQLRAEWNRLQNDWSALRKVYMELTAQVMLAREQRSQVSSQLAMLRRNTKDEKGKENSAGRDEYNRYAPGLQTAINNLDNVIVRTELKGAELVQNAQVIEAQLQQIVVAGEAIGEQFAMQKEQFAQEAKMLAGREARTKRHEPKAPKLNERALTFSSYDPFSYEAEKQRVLDALGDR